MYYKYTRCKGKTIEKKIPYTIELPFIFLSAHVNKLLINPKKIYLTVIIIMKELQKICWLIFKIVLNAILIKI